MSADAFWHHAANSLANTLQAGPVGDTAHTGVYRMDDLNEKDAATIMEVCKTSLLSYLLNSHLPPLPVPAADLQDFVSTAEWKAKRTDTILDWVLLHLAGAAGSRFWDKDGISKVNTVPGFDDARITGLSSQRYIVVSGAISRLLQSASLDQPTAASLKHQGSGVSLPLELIFTSAGKDCDSLVVLSITADKRLAMFAFDASLPSPNTISEPACAYVYVSQNVYMYCMYVGVLYIHIQKVHVCVYIFTPMCICQYVYVLYVCVCI